MAVEITIALSDEDIRVIRDVRVTSTLTSQYYEEKEISDENLTEEEYEEYSKWIFRELLFNRMEALIDNELLKAMPKDATKKQRINSDNEFVLLSGEELKKLVNKWSEYHVEHDARLSPEYFKRLLRSWQTIYRKQNGMSMLDTF